MDALGSVIVIDSVEGSFVKVPSHYQHPQELQGLHHLRGFKHLPEYSLVVAIRMVSTTEVGSYY